MLSILTAALCLLLFCLPLHAQDAPQPPPHPTGGGLLGILQRAMMGQPVIAVPDGKLDADLPADAFHERDTLLTKLQAVCAAASPEGDPLIPFAVRTAWVLAPETQDVVNPALQRLTVREAKSRDALLDDLLASLTPAQMRRLGSARGLGYGDLDASQRDLLARMLRPPLVIRERVPAKRPAAGSGDAEPEDARVVATLDAPDLTRARLSGRLIRGGFFVRDAPRSYGFIPNPDIEPKRWLSLETEGALLPDSGLDLPAFVPAPNRYKPSDLDGKALSAPIGVQGTMPLAMVLQQAERVTGLHMVADAPYRGVPVFIGSAKIPAGDVLDALRLALTAAWRKLDGKSILAWDRRGLGAVEQEIAEATARLRGDVRDQTLQPWSDNTLRALALVLPFDPDDAFAPTADQRARLIAMPDTATSGIPFTELTSAQQEAIRRAAATEDIRDIGDEEGSTARPITEEDMRRLRLDGGVATRLSLTLPGLDPVDIVSSAGDASLSRHIEEATEPAPEPQPLALSAPVRGLMVPVLGASRLAELADEMHRAGLNTLFYPALSGGYATFPTKAFPLHPALRGEDGLAAAVSIMEPKGIRVVAYLNTLAWQDAGQTPHWMDRHPEWWDVDILGRPRLSWLEKLPPEAAAQYDEPGAPHNYVRAGEPEVAAKLLALVDGLMAREGTGGLALSEWAPMMLMTEQGEDAPDLGYALPERIAAFRATGLDPVDAMGSADVPLPRGLRGRINPWARVDPEAPEAPDPATALLSRLIGAAKAKRPDAPVYALDGLNGRNLGAPGALPAGAPHPDLVLHPYLIGPTPPRGLYLQMIPPQVNDADASVPPALAGLPVEMQRLLLQRSPRLRTLSACVLDFRAAPGSLTDSLRWLKPPEANGKSGPKP